VKKLVTYRMNNDIVVLINELANEYQTTKVHIVENAVRTYASLKKFHNKDLLKFIGKIDKNEIKKIKKVL